MQLATGEDVRAALLLTAQRWNELAERLAAMQSADRRERSATISEGTGGLPRAR